MIGGNQIVGFPGVIETLQVNVIVIVAGTGNGIQAAVVVVDAGIAHIQHFIVAGPAGRPVMSHSLIGNRGGAVESVGAQGSPHADFPAFGADIFNELVHVGSDIFGVSLVVFVGADVELASLENGIVPIQIFIQQGFDERQNILIAQVNVIAVQHQGAVIVGDEAGMSRGIDFRDNFNAVFRAAFLVVPVVFLGIYFIRIQTAVKGRILFAFDAQGMSLFAAVIINMNVEFIELEESHVFGDFFQIIKRHIEAGDVLHAGTHFIGRIVPDHAFWQCPFILHENLNQSGSAVQNAFSSGSGNGSHIRCIQGIAFFS